MSNLIRMCILSIFLASCGNSQEFKESIDSQFAESIKNIDIDWATVNAEVFTPRCTTCHSKYGDYEIVKANINAIVGMVRADFMPKDGPLSDTEKATLFAWVDAGLPKDNLQKEPGQNTPTPGPVVPVPLPTEDRLTFANLNQKVFTPQCLKCHGDFNDYSVVKSKIDAIVNMVRIGAMPMGGQLDPELKTLLFEWAAAGAPQDSTGPTPNPPTPTPIPVPTPLPLEANYESLNQHIFAKKCVACHNPSGRASFLDLSTYEAIVSNSKELFDFRRPWKSDIIDEITDDDDPMPPLSSPFEGVTRAEVRMLEKWIGNRIPRT